MLWQRGAGHDGQLQSFQAEAYGTYIPSHIEQHLTQFQVFTACTVHCCIISPLFSWVAPSTLFYESKRVVFLLQSQFTVRYRNVLG